MVSVRTALRPTPTGAGGAPNQPPGGRSPQMRRFHSERHIGHGRQATRVSRTGPESLPPRARADLHSGSTQRAPIWSCCPSPGRITTGVQNGGSVRASRACSGITERELACQGRNAGSPIRNVYRLARHPRAAMRRASGYGMAAGSNGRGGGGSTERTSDRSGRRSVTFRDHRDAVWGRVGESREHRLACGSGLGGLAVRLYLWSFRMGGHPEHLTAPVGEDGRRAVIIANAWTMPRPMCAGQGKAGTGRPGRPGR